MVAHSLARRHPARVAGLVLVDAPLPGLPGWEEAAASPAMWHLGFHRDRDEQGDALAEVLVAGRERVYVRSFLERFAARPGVFSAGDIERNAQGYSGPERPAAGFGMFRALPLDAAENRASRGPPEAPILLILGDCSFGTLEDTIACGLREAGAADVASVLIEECGDWPAEEQPAALAGAIDGFAARVWST
jgi:pimeloyl-ACP methyl ester carboxylesterase